MTDERDPFDDFLDSLGEHDDAPPPNPRFVRALRGDLMKQAAAMPAAGSIPASDDPFRGSLSAPIPLHRPGHRRFDRRWAVSLAAVAALVIALLGTLTGGQDTLLNPAIQAPPDGDRGSIALYRQNAARTGVAPGSGPLTTPAVVWRQTPENPNLVPMLTSEGAIYLVDPNGGVVEARDAATGEQQWSATVGRIGEGPSIAIGHGFVYVPTLGERYSGNGAGYLIALDQQTGQEAWRYESGGTVLMSPAIVDETLYMVGFDYSLRALDATTGEEQWRVQIAPWPQTEATPTAYDLNVYLSDLSPVVADGTAYVTANDGVLYAIDLESREVKWRFETDGVAFLTAPALLDGRIYLASSLMPDISRSSQVAQDGGFEGWVYAIDGESGQPVWSLDTTGMTIARVTAAPGRLFVEFDGGVRIHDPESGELRGNQIGPDSRLSNVFITERTLYAYDPAGKLVGYHLEEDQGAVRPLRPAWQVFLGGWVTQPLLADGLLIVRGADNSLFAIGPSDDAEAAVATPAGVTDLSGLPPCQPAREEPTGPFTGTPEASVIPGDGPSTDRQTGMEILLEEIPAGGPASAEAEQGILDSLEHIGACVDRGESTASFFTDDFFRRPGVTWQNRITQINGYVPRDQGNQVISSFDESRVLSDGRVAIIQMYAEEHGWLVVFKEVNSVWLIDEIGQIVPELGGRG